MTWHSLHGGAVAAPSHEETARVERHMLGGQEMHLASALGTASQAYDPPQLTEHEPVPDDARDRGDVDHLRPLEELLVIGAHEVLTADCYEWRIGVEVVADCALHRRRHQGEQGGHVLLAQRGQEAHP